MSSPSATCELWLDGTRVPCRPQDLEDGLPTALDGLSLNWGRTSVLEQPGVGSAAFVIRDPRTSRRGRLVPGGCNDFESWVDGAWGTGGGAAVNKTDAWSVDGTHSIRVTSAGTTASSAYPWGPVAGTMARVGVRPGSTYTISATVLITTRQSGPLSSAARAVRVDWTGGSSPGFAQQAAPNAPGVYRVMATFTVPADATNVYARLFNGSQNPAEALWWDALILEEGETDGAWPIADPHVGATVQVFATGRLPSPGDTSIMTDGSFEATGTGTLPDNRAAVSGSPTLTVMATGGAVGPKRLRILPNSLVPRQVTVTLPPVPFAVEGQTPAAWDTIPRIRPGDTWRFTAWVKGPPRRAADIIAVPYSAPWKSAAEPRQLLSVQAAPVPGDLEWHQVAGTITSRATQDLWVSLGLAITLPSGETWAEQGEEDWTSQGALTWADFEPVYLDGLELLVPNETDRRALVFSGEVSDVSVKAAGNDVAIEYEVTAVDLGAQFENDSIGDEPWPRQTLAVRANRIRDLARLQVPLNIDPGLQPVNVSYRDVDNQPVLGLLQDLAQTAGGTLWTAVHATTGPYLWMEDPDTRAAVRQLHSEGGLIKITDSTRGVALLSARDILRDPVTWTQSVAEVVTTVDIGWLEQTTDPETGQPSPTERTTTATDAAAVDVYGLRRLSVSTELTSDADALMLAQRLLNQSRGTDWKADGYTLDTGQIQDEISTVPESDRMQALMEMLDGTTRIGLAVTLIELPDYTPGGSSESSVYLEGGTYTFSDGAWILDLTISPSIGQGESAKWNELPSSWRWQNLDPSITWADLYGVAAPTP